MVTVEELQEALKELEDVKKGLKGKAKKAPAKTVKKALPIKPMPRVLKWEDIFSKQEADTGVPGTEIMVMHHPQGKVLQEYSYTAKSTPVRIVIVKPPTEYTPIYDMHLPTVGEGTRIIMDEVREEITSKVGVGLQEVLDIKAGGRVDDRYRKSAEKRFKDYLPKLDEKTEALLLDLMLNDMLGLGKMEFLLSDDSLEEIVVNNSVEPIWVYHKMHGWLKTNLKVRDEKQVYEYADGIARRAERQINTLNPLMDAHLTTGERSNATLFPISSKGNTMTVRKFAREPWSIVDFMDNGTVSPGIAAFIWMGMQYEMNILVSGGTASGKTSLLNAMTPFLPPNHRIISIEDTKELRLPNYLHWVPLVTRQPNPEGKGGVTMLDLMVNSLRMRPDRIIVGEIRRHNEAEVLFEAMHTGHSVYATLHANTAEEVRRRLITPPLDISETLLESLHMVLVQFRHRRLGIRRTLEFAEVLPTSEGTISFRTLFRWRPTEDAFMMVKDSIRVMPEIQLFSGLSDRELKDELGNKQKILEWLLKNNVRRTDDIGLVIGRYYTSPDEIVNAAKAGKKPEAVV
ncbi:MAG: CpaF family protein [Candidatus Diapherotrites archaeon]|nr:CpaF family protein [Candidatus Diapherotrites archaeon]